MVLLIVKAAASSGVPLSSSTVSDSTVMASKPPARSTSHTRSGLLKAKGPGLPGGGSFGSGTTAIAAARGSANHGFRSTGCQQTKARRPPGLVARARLAKAATGSSKNITPNLEATTSKWPAGSCATCASASRTSTLARPLDAARSCSRSRSGRDTSRPITRPAGPTRPASSSVVAPLPQPTSSTWSPGDAATAASRGGRNTASIVSRQVLAGHPLVGALLVPVADLLLVGAHADRPSATSTAASSAAAITSSRSSSLWARPGKAISYGPGARATPRRSMAWKKAP